MKKTQKRVAYLYERPASEAEEMGCKPLDVYIDFPKTNRSELTLLMGPKGVIEGDTVVVRSISDFGDGRRGKMIQAQLEERGITVEEIPKKDAPRNRGRPSRVEFEDMAAFEAGCAVWWSPAEKNYAIMSIGRQLGREVDENWIKHRCGNRYGSDAEKDAKRSAARKRYRLDK